MGDRWQVMAARRCGGEAPCMIPSTKSPLGPNWKEATSPRVQLFPSPGWGEKAGGDGMRKKVRDRWKATSFMDRHHAGMSMVLPDPCALPYVLGALRVMNHLPHV